MTQSEEQGSFNFIEADGIKIAELGPQSAGIETVQQALDLMAEATYDGAQSLILYDTQLPAAFFDLSTRLAGDILQKFAQYRVRLAIVGDFSQYPSQPLKAFIAESNRGNQIFFVPDKDEALKRLANQMP